MSFSISNLAALLMATTSVLSAPSPAHLNARQGPQLAGVTIPQPTNGTWDQARCISDSALPATQFVMTVPGDKPLETGGCGEGILDNLRGRCGVITSWQCAYVGAGDQETALVDFWVSNFCTDYDATQAVVAATSGKVTLDCLEATDPQNGPDLSNLFPEMFEMPEDGEAP